MKDLGANVVRVHLQLGKFMIDANRPDEKSLDRLGRLLTLAERTGLYLDLTGLGCYHKKDVPAWYDALSESGRWAVQGRFWEAIARRCADSPAVFCYDLMNEPVVPGKRDPGDWLAGAFGGKHFVQFVTLDSGNQAPARGRPPVDPHADGSHSSARPSPPDHRRPGPLEPRPPRPHVRLRPREGRRRPRLRQRHIYPERGKVKEALETLKGFAVGKPVVIEETFPLVVLDRGSRSVHRGIPGHRRGLDRVLLGRDAGAATTAEDDLGRPDPGLAGVLPAACGRSQA